MSEFGLGSRVYSIGVVEGVECTDGKLHVELMSDIHLPSSVQRLDHEAESNIATSRILSQCCAKIHSPSINKSRTVRRMGINELKHQHSYITVSQDLSSPACLENHRRPDQGSLSARADLMNVTMRSNRRAGKTLTSCQDAQRVCHRKHHTRSRVRQHFR